MADFNVARTKFNQIVMLQNRGYQIDPEEQQFLNDYLAAGDYAGWPGYGGQVPANLLQARNYYRGSDGDIITVVYIPLSRQPGVYQGKVSKGDLSAQLAPVQAQLGATLKHLILISDPLNSNADVDLLQMISDAVLRVEQFSYEDLSLQAYQHNSTPPHRLLSAAEASQLLAGGRTTRGKLPRISQNDPVAKYYGASPGEIIEFMRTDDLFGQLVPYWRVVIRS